MDITSVQNSRVKYIVRLRDDKRQRRADGLMLVEGYDEIQLALASGHKPRMIFSASELVAPQIDLVQADAERITVNRAVFEKMSYRENPDGWLAVFPIPQVSLDDIKLSASPLVIVAESVEKPGNLGAILRTAEAAGADGVMLPDRHSAGLSETVARASAGAIEHVRVARVGNLVQALEALKARGVWTVGFDASGGERWDAVDLTRPIALVLGGGMEGLVRELLLHKPERIDYVELNPVLLPLLRPHLHHAPPCGRRLDHPLALADGVRERLLDVDVLAGLAGQNCHFGVPVVRRGDDDDIDGLVRQ